MKTTLGSRILKIILRGSQCLLLLSPLLGLYDRCLRMMPVEHFSFLQCMGLRVLSYGLSFFLIYILSLYIQLVDFYQKGELFSAASNILVKRMIKFSLLFSFIQIVLTLFSHYCASESISVNGVRGAEFDVQLIKTYAFAFLIQYLILWRVGVWFSRKCRAREEANLTI